ncbi:hypothetical protein B2G71_08645 [Novosphingobium sp. PC22D]|nr:hypothetical protein B2G71_08645 [Novosphingobium sp. PC22D]
MKTGVAGLRVLLVEDEPLVALDLEMALEDAGARILGPAPNVAVAMDLIEGAKRIDAAILDINLQDSDSYPIAERLMAIGVPFVFHTGHGSQVELGSRFPGAPVCRKPIATQTLLDIVGSLLPQTRQ